MIKRTWAKHHITLCNKGGTILVPIYSTLNSSHDWSTFLLAALEIKSENASFTWNDLPTSCELRGPYQMVFPLIARLLVIKVTSKNESRIIELFICRCTKLSLNINNILSFMGFFFPQLDQTEQWVLCSSSWNWLKLSEIMLSLPAHSEQKFQHGKKQLWNSFNWFCEETRLEQHR